MSDKPKRPKDANQLAHMIAGIATGDKPVYSMDTSGQRKGGIKGSKTRSAVLTPEQRSEVAQVAAAARWKKSED